MRTIADTYEELQTLYERAVTPEMSEEDKDGLWCGLEEEATDFFWVRNCAFRWDVPRQEPETKPRRKVPKTYMTGRKRPAK